MADYSGVADSVKQAVRVGLELDPAVGVKEAWQPQARPGQDVSELTIGEWVGQALGAASSCWGNLEGAGIFDSTRCAGISAALEAHIQGLFAAFVKEAEARRKVSDEYLRQQLTCTREHRDEPDHEHNDE